MRIAFKMRVNKGMEAEYQRRHNPIWKELEDKLIESGVLTYSIFLDSTGNLFAYAEIESLDKWKAIADTDICRKWWSYMEPLMPCNPDGSPENEELKEVFHMARIRKS